MTAAELIARRNALGLTQAECARRLGLPAPNLCRWETGAVGISHLRADWLDRELSRLERAPA